MVAIAMPPLGTDFLNGFHRHDTYTQLNIHITQGRGSSFSLEIPMGLRFLTQSKLFTEEELLDLVPLKHLEN